MNAARGEKRGSRRGIEQEGEKTWSEKESARAQVRERVSEKERGQRERRGRGVDVDGGAGGRGGGEEVVTRRGRRDESGRSQRPKITAMTFTFSHSPPRVSLVLSPAFFFLFLSLRLSSSPLPPSPCSPAIRRRFFVLLLPKSCENVGMHIGWSGRQEFAYAS